MISPVDGLWNFRAVDLPGGARVFRSDSPHRLNAAEWATLRDVGVRAVLDLRNEEEAVEQPSVDHGCAHRRVSLEAGLQDGPMRSFFEDGRIATPLYYQPFTERWPDRVSDALVALAELGPGTLVHCAKGCDRTGMIIALTLEALGVPRSTIVQDYLATEQNIVSPRARALEIRDDTAAIAEVLTRFDTSLEDALNRYLDTCQVFVDQRRHLLRSAFS